MKNPTIAQLETLLLVGIAHFAFKTKEGEIRKAFGTLKPGIIPAKGSEKFEEAKELLCEIKEDLLTKNDTSLPPYFDRLDSLVGHFNKQAKPKAMNSNVVYYDLEKQAFRSFVPENLVEIYTGE